VRAARHALERLAANDASPADGGWMARCLAELTQREQVEEPPCR
jgi:hypothetical protein